MKSPLFASQDKEQGSLHPSGSPVRFFSWLWEPITWIIAFFVFLYRVIWAICRSWARDTDADEFKEEEP